MSREGRAGLRADQVEIVLPPRASAAIDLDLVDLTERIAGIHPELHEVAGLLGGEYGYGIDYENDVFVMRRYYWGDCLCGWSEMSFSEPHDAGCYQVLVRDDLLTRGWTLHDAGFAVAPKGMPYDQWNSVENEVRSRRCAEFGLPFPNGCAIHCTCTHTERLHRWYEANKKGKDGHADDCPVVLPNFRHHASGVEIRWYKWIGRDMEGAESVTAEDWSRIMAECIGSLK